MFRKLFLMSVIAFSPLYGMDIVRIGSGSACIVGGSALIIQGISKQTAQVNERIRSYNRPQADCQPIDLEHWMKEIVFPVVVGGALLSTGIVLGWK